MAKNIEPMEAKELMRDYVMKKGALAFGVADVQTLEKITGTQTTTTKRHTAQSTGNPHLRRTSARRTRPRTPRLTHRPPAMPNTEGGEAGKRRVAAKLQ